MSACLQCRDLQVDESALTGESVPVIKKEETLDPETILADRRNMAYAGTLVTYGQAQAVIVATGDNTETGRISEMIAQATDLSTPLTKKIASFSKVLLIAILVLAALTFAVGIWRGEGAVDMFMAAVALAVGAIPEGLPAAVTITLAIGVNRMAKRKAIIRKLPAVETLGSTTVICSDKTGTLTENQMTVRRIFAGDTFFDVEGNGYAPEGKIVSDGAEVYRETCRSLLSETLMAGLLCNDSRLVEADSLWRVEGDPTEGALITAAAKAGLTPQDAENRHPGWISCPLNRNVSSWRRCTKPPEETCCISKARLKRCWRHARRVCQQTAKQPHSIKEDILQKGGRAGRPRDCASWRWHARKSTRKSWKWMIACPV